MALASPFISAKPLPKATPLASPPPASRPASIRGSAASAAATARRQIRAQQPIMNTNGSDTIQVVLHYCVALDGEDPLFIFQR